MLLVGRVVVTVLHGFPLGESGICHMLADFEARLLGGRAVQLEPLGEA